VIVPTFPTVAPSCGASEVILEAMIVPMPGSARVSWSALSFTNSR